MMEKLRSFTLDRLKERSTWIAIGFVCSAAGLKFAVDLDWEKATNIGLFLAAAIQMVWPDTKL